MLVLAAAVVIPGGDCAWEDGAAAAGLSWAVAGLKSSVVHMSDSTNRPETDKVDDMHYMTSG